MNEIVKTTEVYIETLTGEKVGIKPLAANLRKQIPIYLTGAYELCEGLLLGRRICFAFVDREDESTPAQYAKRAQALELATGLLPVFVLESVASYNTQRLTRQRVNFIVPGKQLFLPGLLMDLGRSSKEEPLPETIPASAQLMILYHLEVVVLNGKSGKEIAQLMNISSTNVTRAIQWMTAKGLATTIGSKTKYLHFQQRGKALWKAAFPYLRSPVLRTVRTDSKPQGYVCGQNALAEYGMLVDANHVMVAIGPKEYRAIRQDTDARYGENEIQIWRYNPGHLAKILRVDKLSLYLSLMDSEDERVQKELRILLDEMKWLEG